ncbi:hypothetical protein [Shewanella subflava]|uniref:Uncharacterized protein n=1 Tax=Shewanella subflava TaxID=2986476 RepID=A0ABT3I599_9GAMM|nr:hypothetical protein [Shewanella subflava]MCW3171240.1 hypothetical protein [Shewanella subflava]
MSKSFTTTFGTVKISEPFACFATGDKSVEVSYKPDNYNGWGITKTWPLCSLSGSFEQADADFFASVAEEKLRISRPMEQQA